MATDTGVGWEAPGAASAVPTQTIDPTSIQQLLWLTALIAVVSLPHLWSVQVWVIGSLLATIIWRLGAAMRWWRLPGTLLRAALTLVGSFAVAFSYRQISGIDAGSALLILMLALKLLETHTARDRSIVILIAWFVLFAGFLREQSVASIPQLAAGVIVGTLALLQSTRTSSPLPAVRGLLLTGRLLLHALPLAVVLFLLFPRLPGPFWALPSGGGAGKTGLSDQMSPGDITSLAQSDEVAFRVRFNGAVPRQAELYWRGPVLERFDGRRWSTRPESARGRAAAGPRPLIADTTATYDYELTLEPHRQRWLLPLETPVAWDRRDGVLTGGLELLSARPIERRIAWRGRSVAAGAFWERQDPGPVDRELPARQNPRSLALARDLRASASSDGDYLRSILRMFRAQEFYYTLQPPALGENPVDDFLFRTRAGFCEHYASAFAQLARAAGLPARVVTGYQGGEPNPVADYWIVRQSDAHAWAEVWLDGRWIRYDPTAAVAPERIESGLDAALPGSATAGLPLLGNAPWVERVALSWDAINATWDRWVLAFGPDQQTELLERLGFEAPSLRDLALVCAVTVSGVLLLFTWLGLRTNEARRDPVEQSWQRFCQRLAKITRPRGAAEGPAEYAAAVAAVRPDLAGPVSALAAQYLRLRYDGLPVAADVDRFARLVRQCRLPPAPARG